MISLFNGKPFQVGYFYNRNAFIRLQEMIKIIKPDHIYCQLIRTAEYAIHSEINKTIDYQDVFSKGVERRIRFSPFWFKPILYMEYRRLLHYEKKVFSLFNNKTIISESDRNFIPHPEKHLIHIIPNGVDLNYFAPTNTAKTTDLLFTGNMGYAPNIQSAKFLINEIMPKILAKRPQTRLKVVGANPDPDLFLLSSKNVEIVGWVDDIRDSYRTATVFIAPMQIGTGLQNKLLEAMAMNMPCITSELANKSLGAIPRKEILIGSSPDDYASHVIRLLEDVNFAAEIASNGNSMVRSRFNWTSTVSRLEQIIVNK